MMNVGFVAPLEIARLCPAHTQALLDFRHSLKESGDSTWFDPHPFTEPYVATLCEPCRLDLHYVLCAGTAVIGYGLLRGWDEGYDVPSLGIAIHPGHRGRGLAALLMHFLHCAAQLRGSARVRLRVHPQNDRAVALYLRMGYQFQDGANPSNALLRIAFKELTK